MSKVGKKDMAFKDKYKILHTRKMLAVSLAIIAVGIVIAAYSSIPSTARAAHGSGPSAPDGIDSGVKSGAEVCKSGDTLGDRGSTAGTSGVGSGDNRLHVPVKDFEAESYLRSIALNIRAIEGDTKLIEGDTRAIRYYLRVLCEKEYVHDHTIQHAWAEVIGEFVDNVLAWVTSAYGGNPIFLTNQTIYYTLVDQEVTLTFLREITDSNIGMTTKRTIITAIINEMFQEVFPYLLEGEENEGAPDGVADALSENFIKAGGYLEYYKNNINDASRWIALARDDWETRRLKALEYEKEKLAWGRGFFSYENCDLAVYTDYPEDRRNCRIVTPGALIQDQTAFVLGSALRQMELADEYEEWISLSAFAVLQSSLNFDGINTERTRTSLPDRAASPAEITDEIFIGNPDYTLEADLFPSEFDTFIDSGTAKEKKEDFRVRLLGAVGDYYKEIESLD